MAVQSQKKQFTLRELITGLDVTIKGDENCLISGVGTLAQANPGEISFLINPIYKKYLPTTAASAVIINHDDEVDCQANLIVSPDPYYTYAKIAAYFDDKPVSSAGIHTTAVIEKDASIHPSASVGAFSYIGKNVKIGAGVCIGTHCSIGDESEIGDDSVLHANVTIYHKVKIGQRVQIASGTVIGSDGFGIAKHAGTWHKVPQLGGVIIEDDVEIGSNCSIDRGAIESTLLGRGVKLDNLIQIGHNVRIGEHTAIAGCVGIAGSAKIGSHCLLGGGAGVAGHISLTDNVMITGFSAITRTIHEPGVYSSGVGGVVKNKEWRKTSARIHRLEELTQRIKQLEHLLKELLESKET